MAFIINGAKKVQVGTKAVDEHVACRAFMLVNDSDSTVYFREKEEDGETVTAETGFALRPGQLIQTVMAAQTLSMLAEKDNAVVRILYGTEV